MNTYSKARRAKAATQDGSGRLPSNLSTVRRCHGAIHKFVEQLRGELDEALRNAKSRNLGPARHVEAIGQFLLHHQRAKQPAKAAVLAAPADISIGPDLAVGLKYIDAAALGERVGAWSQIVADLAHYEGVPFPRKPLTIGARKNRHRSTAPEQDAEQETIASLEHEGQALVGLVSDLVARFERRLMAGSTKHKRKVDGSPKLLTAPEAAKRLGVAPEKVRGWIASGELAATNVAQEGSSRPRWRIDEKDLGQFAKSRQPMKSRPAAQRRSKKKSNDKEYF